MAYWQYDVTSYWLQDLLDVREAQGYDPDPAGPAMLYCDQEGRCFFDAMPNSYVQSIIMVLDGRGHEGWELVQVVFRREQMICFWKRRVEGTA